jgi:Bacterial regulatory proteins, lacI family
VAAPRVTLLDVARRAGVSRTTASFVMSGRTDMRISAEVSEQVLSAARELNYRPNLVARSLRTSSTRTIGLISDTIAAGAFAGEVIRGSLTTALQHGHLLFIGETGGAAAVEERLIQELLDRGVDGFIYAAMYTRRARPSPSLRSHGLVLLNCLADHLGVPAVVPTSGKPAARPPGPCWRPDTANTSTSSARSCPTASPGWSAAAAWRRPSPARASGSPGRSRAAGGRRPPTTRSPRSWRPARPPRRCSASTTASPSGPTRRSPRRAGASPTRCRSSPSTTPTWPVGSARS